MAPSLDISQFFDVFFEESEELLAEMEGLLLAVDVSSASPEECNAIFRTAHSVKGGAATFGLDDMVEIAHIMESLLDDIRKGSRKLTEAHVSVFLQAKDILKRQLNGHHQKQPIGSDASLDVLALLRSLSLQGPDDFGAAGQSDFPEAQTKAKIKLPKIERPHCFRMELPGMSEDDLNALVAELQLKGSLTSDKLPNGKTVLVLETTENLDTVVAICAFMFNPEDIHIAEETVQSNGKGASECFLPKQNGPTAGIQDLTYVRVNLEKVDQLMNLVGELVITQAMIDQHIGGLESARHGQLVSHLATLARNTHDLQESVMAIRMMPIELVFSRFPRMVRELAAKLGKKVKLITIGGAFELDKGLIERIVDPITHLVRNSVDHGLEQPHIRLASNKSETGTITLSAIHEGGHIIVQVIDDGAGFDRGCIMRKAKDFGISVSEEMSDEELWEVVFTPGFTTVPSITEISGRGVGMDVVKRNISAMGGSVHILSTLGMGTTVTISLPLTLAILDGMLVMAGEEIYILPLLSVVESLKPMPEQIHHITGKEMVIRVREEYIPLIFLHDLLDIQPRCSNPVDGIVVIVEGLGKKAALLIDNLLGQQQIVVKNIETNFRKIPWISGATILGDGNVSLILDVPSLLNIHKRFELQRFPHRIVT